MLQVMRLILRIRVLYISIALLCKNFVYDFGSRFSELLNCLQGSYCDLKAPELGRRIGLSS